jgi:hypothetical protein
MKGLIREYFNARFKDYHFPCTDAESCAAMLNQPWIISLMAAVVIICLYLNYTRGRP